jgi:16S rRNA processing protein RimM
VRLVVGTIVAAHGVLGEFKLRPATDEPDHLQRVKRVQIGDEERTRRLLGVRHHGDALLLRVEGVTSPEQVDALRGLPVRISGRDAQALEPGEFFLYQLIGLSVVDEAGADLGRVADLIETGARDVIVVGPTAGGAELLVPFHPEFVLEVTPEAGKMVVRPPVYYDDTANSSVSVASQPDRSVAARPGGSGRRASRSSARATSGRQDEMISETGQRSTPR